MSIYALPESKYTRRKVGKDGSTMDDIVIHCSDTGAAMDCNARDIRYWHQNERTWLDIGYHFVIRRDGSLELGRPVWAQGAGVAGWNAQSVLICMVGGRAAMGGPENNFTTAQWTTLKSLIVLLREMDPGAERVVGHRDYPGVQKYCPSFDVKTWLRNVGL